MTESDMLSGTALGRAPRATCRFVHSDDPRSVIVEVSRLASEGGSGAPDPDTWWVEAQFDDSTFGRDPLIAVADKAGTDGLPFQRGATWLRSLSRSGRVDGRQVSDTWVLEVVGPASLRSVRTGWPDLELATEWLAVAGTEATLPSYRIERPQGWSDHLACQRSDGPRSAPLVFAEWNSAGQLQRCIEEVPDGFFKVHRSADGIQPTDLAYALPDLAALRGDTDWRKLPLTGGHFEELWQVALSGRIPPSARSHP